MTSQLSHDLPSVTVIVTTKDNSSTIRECVQSILRLNYPKERLKCLVIDASNNDSTASVIRDLPVKIVHYRGNAPASYNFALKSTDTELVAFVDGDAKTEPQWLIELVKRINSPTVGGAAGPIATWNESSILPRCIGYELESRYNEPKKVSRTSTTNLVLRRDVLEMIGGFDEDLPTGYDGDVGYRITSKGYTIAFAPEAKVYHFHRPTFTSFLKQQYNYARNDLTLYSKHPGLAKGDNVTSKWMIAQPILIAASLASLIFGAIVALATGLAVRPASSVLFAASAALAVLLIGSYAVNSLSLALRARDLTAWPVLFCILSGRALAWTIGGGMGLLGYARRSR